MSYIIAPARTKDIELTPSERLRERLHFARVRRVEIGYIRQLRAVARHVGDIIRAFPAGDPLSVQQIVEYLNRYSYLIRPWARAAANRMVTEVSQRDQQAWLKMARQIGISLRQEMDTAPIGDEVARIITEQVELITSIPIEAAEEVQEKALEYVTGGRRYAAMVPSIQAQVYSDLAHKAHSRATLIARTEVAKAAGSLTQARAEYVGSTHYVWQTARDRDVRPYHKRLQGTVQAWNDPPIAEANGERHHPGQFPNCRCFAEPILPETIT